MLERQENAARGCTADFHRGGYLTAAKRLGGFGQDLQTRKASSQRSSKVSLLNLSAGHYQLLGLSGKLEYSVR
jgi:hypothetical protein